MIGLSVSFCVRDIALGQVRYEDVEYVVGSTRAATAGDWEKVIAKYKKTYWLWSDVPDEAEVICRRLLAEGKIQQPRLEGWYGTDITKGHWVDAPNQIKEWRG